MPSHYYATPIGRETEEPTEEAFELPSHDGRENRPNNLASMPIAAHPAPLLVGRSPVMQHLLATIDRVASSNSSVLITGPTGTGKELVASSIHERSPRRHAPFVDINCSAIPDSLFESELFGHQRGTFTGAHESRRGLIEGAAGGTLFLDEVDALSLPAQAKLLRVIQERRVRRLGGRENIEVDVRIIAATNRDLQAAVAAGAFRPDLFFRLRVVPLQVPELHERTEDIPLLVEHFLKRHAERRREPVRRFSGEALRALTGTGLNYQWPGNVRELENVVEYALAIGSGPELTVHDLPPSLLASCVERSANLGDWVLTDAPLEEVERRYILLMFERHGRQQVKTAAALGIDRRTLYRKLLQYGVLDNPGE